MEQAQPIIKAWYDSPVIVGFLNNLPLLVFGLIALYLVLKVTNELKVKIGDKEVSLSSKKKEVLMPVVKVLTDYADWKSDLQKEYFKDFEALNKEAKRLAKLGVDNHNAMLSEEFAKQVKATNRPRQIELTSQSFKLIMFKLNQEELALLMGIYEVNHLHEKSQEELDKLVEERYKDLISIYHLVVQTYWIKGMVDSKIFYQACKNVITESKELVRSAILGFKALSDKKFALNTEYSKLDTDVKEYVVTNAALPLDAYTRLHDLFKANI